MQTIKTSQYPNISFILLNCTALIMSLLIVLLSTHIRLGEAGLGCDPWPECYASLSLADGVKGLEIPDTEFKTFRTMHRYVASILGINILIIMMMAIWYRKQISPLLPVLMFLVVIFLSILGVATPTRALPLVTLGNILGGIVLSGLVWRQVLQTRARNVVPGPLVLFLVSATLTVQLISGAWASANYTGSACPKLVMCSYTDNLSGNLLDSFNIFRKLKLNSDNRLVLDETSSIIQFSHRIIAVLLLILVVTALWKVKRNHPVLFKPMLIVSCFFFTEFTLGIFNVLSDMPLWTNTLHNLLAVGLLFSTINLTMLSHLNRTDQ
ncbi:MAG: COX15/CtaA family protein, partial [Gammaproteobacteria bacterium]|nr:COX15/CtaA family protein [Gammaproteobacteria bacterium]